MKLKVAPSPFAVLCHYAVMCCDVIRFAELINPLACAGAGCDVGPILLVFNFQGSLYKDDESTVVAIADSFRYYKVTIVLAHCTGIAVAVAVLWFNSLL